MEEVIRVISFVTLIAFAEGYWLPSAAANVCVNPRVRNVEACGFVLDQFGGRVPDASLNFRLDIDSMSLKSDQNGYFYSTSLNGPEFLLNVTATGFASAGTKIEHLRRPGKRCTKPIYVLLQVGGDGCTMISAKKSDLPITKRD